jgi:hypothetical protein
MHAQMQIKHAVRVDVFGLQSALIFHGDQVDEPWVQYNGSTVGSYNIRYLHANHHQVARMKSNEIRD